MRRYFLKDVDIEKVLVSYKVSFGEKNYKYFIGYWYNDYKGDELSEQNITIWDKVSPDIKIGNESKISWWWVYRFLW